MNINSHSLGVGNIANMWQMYFYFTSLSKPIKSRIHSESSSTGSWNALAGGWSIFVLAANLIVDGPRAFFGRTVGISGGAATAPVVPKPSLPSLPTRGTWNNKKVYALHRSTLFCSLLSACVLPNRLWEYRRYTMCMYVNVFQKYDLKHPSSGHATRILLDFKRLGHLKPITFGRFR